MNIQNHNFEASKLTQNVRECTKCGALAIFEGDRMRKFNGRKNCDSGGKVAWKAKGWEG